MEPKLAKPTLRVVASTASVAKDVALDIPRALNAIVAPLILWSFPLFLARQALTPWHPLYGYAWDFRAFYDAGSSYLHLHSPYAPATLANLTSEQNFVYPLPVAALFAPLSLLPYPVAAILFIATSGVLLGLALRILGVRDWRCYAAVFLGMPVQIGLKLGTISPLLMVLLAVLWRYRDRERIAAPALALLVISKLFLWPVALWFVFTRRYRTFVFAVGLSLVLVVASAIPIGARALLSYPSLLQAVSHFEAPQSLSPLGLVTALGLSTGQATAVSWLIGGVLLWAAFSAGRRDESKTFRLLIVAALMLSPLVWGHYLVILFVPLALARPRFSPIWFATAWVMNDGFILGRTMFILTTALVLVLVVVQAQIIDFPRVAAWLRAPRGLRLRASEAMLLLWIPFFVGSSDVVKAIDVAAPLRPPVASSHADGSGFLRLMTDNRHVCWRLWTAAVPADAEVQLVRDAGDRVIAQHRLVRGDGTTTCVPVARRDGAKLVRTFGPRSGGYRLVVRYDSGRLVLSGPLLRRVDAGRRGHTNA